eukprot:Hpha_TRINITY_DN30269_c0_g1::TRINITY_DN30269_c0_g1_i1::g.27013::m.27013
MGQTQSNWERKHNIPTLPGGQIAPEGSGLAHPEGRDARILKRHSLIPREVDKHRGWVSGTQLPSASSATAAAAVEGRQPAPRLLTGSQQGGGGGPDPSSLDASLLGSYDTV